MSIPYVFLNTQGTHKVYSRYTQGIHKVTLGYSFDPTRIRGIGAFNEFGLSTRNGPELYLLK